VKLNSSNVSDPIDITEGVLQGEILSPLLYSLYISDLEKAIRDAQTAGVTVNKDVDLQALLFADDTISLNALSVGVRIKLRALERYFDIHSLNLNTSKTKIMIFRPPGRLPTVCAFKYKGQEIEVVNKYVYLGVEFSSSGLFPLASQQFKKKGIAALGALWSILMKSQTF